MCQVLNKLTPAALLGPKKYFDCTEKKKAVFFFKTVEHVDVRPPRLVLHQW